MITCVIEGSDSSKGEPLPEEGDQPRRPPNERTMNSKMGRELSRERKNTYGENSVVNRDCGRSVSDFNVGSEAVPRGSDVDGCRTKSSSGSAGRAVSTTSISMSAFGDSAEIVLIV